MIRAVVGKPGHGKSLYLLYCMMQFVLEGWTVATNIKLKPACPFADRVVLLDDGQFPVFQLPEKGRRCEACFGAGKVKLQVDAGEIPCPTCQGRAAMPDTPYTAFWHYMPWKVAYVFDELDNLFDSMDFARLAAVSRDARLYFKQHRKRADVLVYAVQNLDNIWTRIRRMTESFVVCEWNYRSTKLFAHLPKTWSSFMRAEYDTPEFRGEPMSTGKFWYSEAQEMFNWYETTQLVGDPSLYGWAGKNGAVAS